MRQYWQIKSLHKDKILLFRMGDFFEMFHEDAEKAAPVLNITLTMRNKRAADETKMCGVPHYSIAGPIGKLLAAGFKVAVCDQVEPAHQAKGLVKREVTRILTPGMVYDPSNLDQMTANYLCAFDDQAISFLDISTGEAFYYLSSNEIERKQLICLLNPVELVLTTKQKELSFNKPEWKHFHLSVFDGRNTNLSQSLNTLPGTDSGDAYFSALPSGAPISAVILLKYVLAQQGSKVLRIIQVFQKRRLGSEMQFSSQTQDHLELFKTYSGNKQGSLFTAINRTKTPAGARLLKFRICMPSTDSKVLKQRLDCVENWLTQTEKITMVRKHLSQVGDIERLLGKMSHPQCGVRDLLAIAQSLKAGLSAVTFWTSAPASPSSLQTADQLLNEIVNTIQECSGESKVSVIQKGVSEELDQLISESGKQQLRLRKLEDNEKKQTGIYSLKIRYNSVFGYYIEVTKAHIKKIPTHYIRKQTLTHAERYTTEQLQSIEESVLSLRVKVSKLEEAIFESLKQKLINHFPELFSLSRVLCELDIHVSLAYLALERNYVRPQFSDKKQLILVNSRHPVVEQQLHQTFVPNTIRMKSGECLLLTGPNMAGKSTLMRQVALSAILGQSGSFVPAEQALLPVFNKLFTRIGASDSLSEGLSTFMVEMKESAEILKNADSDSLIILDEIGRGTATYDGMSIAQGVLEFLVLKRKSLIFFATHYHELTQLGKTLSQIRNAHLSVKEQEGVIDFLYTLVSGAALQSYGVHVAQLAGFPQEVIQRASQILQERESHSVVKQQSLISSDPVVKKEMDSMLDFLVHEIKSYPLQERTPLDTVNAVAEWKREIVKKS